MYSIYQTHRRVTLVPFRAMQTTHTSLRGWKADIKTDGDMVLTAFAAFTVIENLASFTIGKYVRNYDR